MRAYLHTLRIICVAISALACLASSTAAQAETPPEEKVFIPFPSPDLSAEWPEIHAMFPATALDSRQSLFPEKAHSLLQRLRKQLDVGAFLVLMNANGSNVRPMPDIYNRLGHRSTREMQDARLSPDGRHVAYYDARLTSDMVANDDWIPPLIVANSDGTNPVVLADGKERRATKNVMWSDDSSCLVYAMFTLDNWDVYQSTADGRTTTRLTKSQYNELPVGISPDCRYVFLSSDRPDSSPRSDARASPMYLLDTTTQRLSPSRHGVWIANDMVVEEHSGDIPSLVFRNVVTDQTATVHVTGAAKTDKTAWGETKWHWELSPDCTRLLYTTQIPVVGNSPSASNACPYHLTTIQWAHGLPVNNQNLPKGRPLVPTTELGPYKRSNALFTADGKWLLYESSTNNVTHLTAQAVTGGQEHRLADMTSVLGWWPASRTRYRIPTESGPSAIATTPAAVPSTNPATAIISEVLAATPAHGAASGRLNVQNLPVTNDNSVERGPFRIRLERERANYFGAIIGGVVHFDAKDDRHWSIQSTRSEWVGDGRRNTRDFTCDVWADGTSVFRVERQDGQVKKAFSVPLDVVSGAFADRVIFTDVAALPPTRGAILRELLALAPVTGVRDELVAGRRYKVLNGLTTLDSFDRCAHRFPLFGGAYRHHETGLLTTTSPMAQVSLYVDASSMRFERVLVQADGRTLFEAQFEDEANSAGPPAHLITSLASQGLKPWDLAIELLCANALPEEQYITVARKRWPFPEDLESKALLPRCIHVALKPEHQYGCMATAQCETCDITKTKATFASAVAAIPDWSAGANGTSWMEHVVEFRGERVVPTQCPKNGVHSAVKAACRHYVPTFEHTDGGCSAGNPSAFVYAIFPWERDKQRAAYWFETIAAVDKSVAVPALMNILTFIGDVEDHQVIREKYPEQARQSWTTKYDLLKNTVVALARHGVAPRHYSDSLRRAIGKPWLNRRSGDWSSLKAVLSVLDIPVIEVIFADVVAALTEFDQKSGNPAELMVILDRVPNHPRSAQQALERAREAAKTSEVRDWAAARLGATATQHPTPAPRATDPFIVGAKWRGTVKAGRRVCDIEIVIEERTGRSFKGIYSNLTDQRLNHRLEGEVLLGGAVAISTFNKDGTLWSNWRLKWEGSQFSGTWSGADNTGGGDIAATLQSTQTPDTPSSTSPNPPVAPSTPTPADLLAAGSTLSGTIDGLPGNPSSGVLTLVIVARAGASFTGRMTIERLGAVMVEGRVSAETATWTCTTPVSGSLVGGVDYSGVFRGNALSGTWTNTKSQIGGSYTMTMAAVELPSAGQAAVTPWTVGSFWDGTVEARGGKPRLTVVIDKCVGEAISGTLSIDGIGDAWFTGTVTNAAPFRVTWTTSKVLRGKISVPSTYEGTVQTGVLSGTWSGVGKNKGTGAFSLTKKSP